ncbi:MAE_28990/MAE_18760 family HEPN-like nuclease [Syntrophotalea carbinolica]|nr:MAE_28990/MAE_18760 family HEPN-like nuclease [Syntrophotalea carbinolica]
MSILETISNDLDWREKEIANMRLLLSSPGVTAGQKLGLLRAAWAMLYAHYEGFCKNTLASFYDVIGRSGVICRDLPQSTRLFALGSRLKILKNMPNGDLLSEIVNFQSCHLSAPPQFPDVDTQSNLWPSVLIELLEAADLSADKVREHRVKLNTLVGRRNQIAHGENNIISEVGYYRTYEDAVYDIMYDLAIQVDNRLSLPPYSTQ